jgi:cold shock CspA family protein
MRYQGRIIEWNEARGFGFVRLQGGDDGRVFAHAKAFSERGCRPRVGDLVSYAVERDGRGRPRAVAIEMVVVAARRAPARRPPPTPAIPLSRVLWVLAAIAILTVLATTDWRTFQGALAAQFASPPQPLPTTRAAPRVVETQAGPAFRCSGKRYCSQMRSCAEARFYLHNCPGTLSDGDGDGIPCEDQWCGH